MNEKLFCDVCKYQANRTSDFNKHLNSNKHYNNFSAFIQNKSKTKNAKTCMCGKEFSHYSSLYRHKKTCKLYIKDDDDNNQDTDNDNILNNSNNALVDSAIQNQLALILVEQLQKKDQFLQQCLQKKDEQIDKLMSELIQMKNTITSQNQIHGNHNTINNNNNNTKIKNFNMALFLDNYCKNAINMSDFMKSMEVQLSDLLHTKDHGIIKGITNIFLNRLKELDIYQRPIHCTDIKRLTMYVKDDDTWHEGETSKQKISDSIQNISAMQIKKIPEWEQKYSEKLNKDDLDEQYMKIVYNASSNVGEKEEDKIIRAIAKDVSINKKSLEISN